MKVRRRIPREPIDGATTYSCPGCGRRTILVGRLSPGMVVYRRCKCKTAAPGGGFERTMVEIRHDGARVVPPGTPEPDGLLEMRCEWCKKLLCKFLPQPGGQIAVRCWRSPCLRMNTLTCANGAVQPDAPGGADPETSNEMMDSQKTCCVSERNGLNSPRRTTCQTSIPMATSPAARPAMPSRRC